jgi:tetraacyldisaccharide-1-P 4'-kinase
MITSQIIEQQTKEFLERGGSIDVVDGFKEVRFERNLDVVVSKKKKKGIGSALNSANAKSRAERESRIKFVFDMLVTNSGMSFRDLQRNIVSKYNVSAHVANTYIREAKGLLYD